MTAVSTSFDFVGPGRGTAAQPESIIHPRNAVVIEIQSSIGRVRAIGRESSRHRVRVRVGRPVYHASENSSHPILLGHSWRPSPSLSSVEIRFSSVGLARTAEGPRPIRSHHHRARAIEYSLSLGLRRSQASESSNWNFKFTYHPSESATQSFLLSS